MTQGFRILSLSCPKGMVEVKVMRVRGRRFHIVSDDQAETH